jgi:DNA-binding MarR family transcriptional regulator
MVKSLDSQAIPPGEVVGAVSALIRAEHRHAAYLARAMNLPSADALALYHLANEPLAASALGERLGLTSGSVTALIDRLVARKLARRVPHETDRRVVLVEMTKTGHGQSWDMLQHFIGTVITMSSELNPTERKTIATFLRELTEAIESDTDQLQARL